MDDHDVSVGGGDDHLRPVCGQPHPHQAVVVERLRTLESFLLGISKNHFKLVGLFSKLRFDQN